MSTDELHAAWEALHAANDRLGWHVGPPTYNPGRREWEHYAFDPSERPVVGHRSREWTAVGNTEVECIREMARCLAEIGAGRVPR